MNWLNKIITGEADEFVHAKLIKYGIGEHPGPRLVLTISGARIAFKGDLDLEKTLVKGYVHGAPAGTQKVKGMVVCYSDRREAFAEQPVPLYWKKSKGKLASVFKAKLDERISLDDLRQLVNVDDPTTFFLLSISPGDGAKPWKLTTKTSFPKGGPKDEEDQEKIKDPVFTKGAFANSPEMMEFMLDAFLPDFKDEIGAKPKKISIGHRIVIYDIEIPDDPTLSFSEKRKLAKRHSRLIRTFSIDGKESTKEYSFVA